jgi:hypothetical protein
MEAKFETVGGCWKLMDSGHLEKKSSGRQENGEGEGSRI